MDRGCQTIQEVLTETAGDLERLPEADRRHVAGCPECSQLAAAERNLGSLLAQAVPPADPELERQILAAIGPVPRRRRLLALAPVAASVVFAAAGAFMMGGVPGGSFATLLPHWCARCWLVLSTAASDWLWALFATSRIADMALSPELLVVATLLTITGLAALYRAARRWRKVPLWRPDA